MLDETVSFTLTKESGYYVGTIDDISYGTHTIRIYAEDIEENINSDEILEFEIEYPDYSYLKPTTTDTTSGTTNTPTSVITSYSIHYTKLYEHSLKKDQLF